MQRPNFLRILLRQIPIIIAALGVITALALGWFSYRYIYRTITDAQMLALLRPQLAVELVDPERIRALDQHFQQLSTLPPIDPTTVRDVFSAPGAAPSSQPQATSRPSR
ncbi:hypothetical protein HY634_01585 [Candidatus Uhrbacteria bacterium]|nr:hypothetical protein [Candidatus Uhrbacteria bacterium]